MVYQEICFPTEHPEATGDYRDRKGSLWQSSVEIGSPAELRGDCGSPSWQVK